jgi:glycosyltransferase involved in cell wall biosynthesis
MKICMVVPWFPSSDADTVESQQGLFDYRQTMKLVERGHEFRIISIKWRGQTSNEAIGDKVKVRRLPPVFIFSKIRYPVPNLLALSREIKSLCADWKPDLLLYSHVIYLTALPAVWLRKLGIPVVVSTDVYPGVSWSYGNLLVDAVGSLYFHLIVRRIFKLADGVHLSNSQLGEYSRRIGLDTRKAFTITRGVDTALFRPGERPAGLREGLGIGQEDVVVLYAGRLDLVKGVGYLLQAAGKVLPRHPEARFLIVGEGGLKSQYEEFARKLAPAVIFAGWRQDVPRLMNAADIFVLPSLAEGAANVAMEASASGLPVVATSVGEVPRIIADGLTGILVSPRDIDGLADALERLFDNPSLAKTMGKAGRKRMEDNYTWEKICGALEREYQRVIDRFKQTRRKKK